MMCSHARRFLVLVEIRLESERFTATAAHVRLGVRVRLNVSSQVGLVGERFVADCTLERFLACMSAYVPLQQPRPREAFATIVALASLIMRPHVHAERGHTDVDLVAVWAPPGFLISEGPVRLPVSGQIGGRRVLLPAIGALVVLVVLGFRRLRGGGGGSPTLGNRRGYRRGWLQFGLVHRVVGDLEAPSFFLQAGMRMGRHVDAQNRAPLRVALQDLAFALDPLEEQPGSLAERLLVLQRSRMVLVLRLRLPRPRTHRSAVLVRELGAPGRGWLLIDDVAGVDQCPSGRG